MTLDQNVITILAVASVNMLASVIAAIYATMEKRKRNSEKIDELVQWKRSFDDCEWRTGRGVKRWLDEYEPMLRKLKKDHG